MVGVARKVISQQTAEKAAEEEERERRKRPIIKQDSHPRVTFEQTDMRFRKTKPYNRTSASSKLSLPDSIRASTLRYGNNDELFLATWETPAKKKANSLRLENFLVAKPTPTREKSERQRKKQRTSLQEPRPHQNKDQSSCNQNQERIRGKKKLSILKSAK